MAIPGSLGYAIYWHSYPGLGDICHSERMDAWSYKKIILYSKQNCKIERQNADLTLCQPFSKNPSLVTNTKLPKKGWGFRGGHARPCRAELLLPAELGRGACLQPERWKNRYAPGRAAGLSLLGLPSCYQLKIPIHNKLRKGVGKDHGRSVLLQQVTSLLPTFT